MTRRMGYLIDLDDPYITLENDYIETCWWILKEFYKGGLIYEGIRYYPIALAGTGLASHEVALGYKEIRSNTITAKFKEKIKTNISWPDNYALDLAANVSLTVGPDIDYLKVEQDGVIYYVSKELADQVLGEDKYTVLEELKGKDLEYIEYEQLMPFVEVDQAYFVTCGDYVTTEDGTGIVHTAPAFGEDDYTTGRKYGLHCSQSCR